MTSVPQAIERLREASEWHSLSGQYPVRQADLRLLLTQYDAAVEALREIANPLAKLDRDARAQGCRLSGMANVIANDPAFIKQIAKDALAILTNQGEKA